MKSITSYFGATGSSQKVLSPVGTHVPPVFTRIERDADLRSDLLAEMQRFRGGVYREDGAIQADELTADGRHQLAIDEQSWHVITLNSSGAVSSCLRFLPEENCTSFDQLWLRHSALTNSPVWGPKLRQATLREMTRAESDRMCFGEVGGWAVAPERRSTTEPLRTILSTYGLLQLLGGCCGIATATRRHDSAPMLRRIGLSALQADGAEFPPYYDPQYSCEMEVLRFDSRCPNPKYRSWIQELSAYLARVPVISSSLSRAPRQLPIGGWAMPAPVPVGLF